MSDAANAVQIRNFTKRYKGETAVDGLNLDVPTGSVFGLLGENGAGKTTTLRTLLGLLAVDGGTMDVLGLDPMKDGLAIRRRVGYVPEMPALYEWMTVAEIGWFASGFHPEPRAGGAAFTGRYDGFIEGFGLPPARKIRDLSKGMKSKVSLALALASAPELLILDEPTSGLDLMVRREFLESMVDLAGNGRTVLLSSHQIAEVERVASHVALLRKGKLVLCEPLDDLRATSFLATLTLADADRVPSPLLLPALTLIDAESSGRQARWLVRAADRSAVAAARELPGVIGLEVETPGLEDIYIGTMRNRVAPSGPAPAPSIRVA